ncbi:MAG: serine/threonine protein kinase [Phycisphaerales bacterium]|nr:MAG: serine/threonine protein kinase [Phycisphaerales bacterium]
MAFTFKHGERPLEGYTIQRGVGRGGFGEVYYAVSDGGREVALKFLRDNPEVELRGVSQCMNLKSPHLVTIFDVKKSADGEYFIVMEYITGPSLRDLLIAEPKGLGVQKATFFLKEISKGLSYLHDRGVVHRDLKPGNIFYDDGYVKIGDYGLSKFIAVSRHSAQTASVGTVHYMAPEVGSGNYSRGIDIYALGVMLYEMLLGRLPFEGSSMGEVLMKHLTERPEIDDLPEPFGRVIHKALEKDPKDRYQTADEMVSDVLGAGSVQESMAGFSPEQSLAGAVARHGRDVPTTPVPSPNPPPPPPRPAGRFEPSDLPPNPRRFAQTASPQMRPFADRLAKRADKLAHKYDKALRKLEKKTGVPRAKLAIEQGPPPSSPPPAAGEGQGGVVLTRRDRRQRMVLACIMALALPLTYGIVAGNAMGRAEWGAAGGMMAFGAVLAAVASFGVLRWLGPQAAPTWVQRVVGALLFAPAAFIGVAPILADSDEEAGLSMAIALLIVGAFARWKRTLQRGASGSVSIGEAIGRAFITLMVAAPLMGIFNARTEECIFVVAGSAGVATLVVQILGWWMLSTAAPQPAEPGSAAETAPQADAPKGARTVRAFALRLGDGACETSLQELDVSCQAPPFSDSPPPPHAIPVAEPSSGPAAVASAVPVAPMRSGFARAFWSLFAFVTIVGAILAFVWSLVVANTAANGPPLHVSISACVAFACMAGFAISKTTLRPRDGFWRETARPFLIALLATALGVCIVMLTPAGDKALRRIETVSMLDSTTGAHTRQLHTYVPRHARAPYVVGVVATSLALAGACGARGRRRVTFAPFVMPGEAGSNYGPDDRAPAQDVLSPTGADAQRV